MNAILVFVLATFAISLLAFVGIALVPGAQSPESATGLPFWLVAVWGPTLAAVLVSMPEGTAVQLVARAAQMDGVRLMAWIGAASPLFILFAMPIFLGGKPDVTDPGVATILGLIAFNVVLGPLGEELGWRGFLQTRLETDVGWLGAALIVGAIWFVWHLPLWLVDSPQREIPIPIFAGHVFAYAVILGAMHVWANGSLLPAILFHLAVNLVAGWALLGGFGTTEDWYRTTLLPYWGIAVAIVILTTVLAPCPNGACEIPTRQEGRPSSS